MNDQCAFNAQGDCSQCTRVIDNKIDDQCHAMCQSLKADVRCRRKINLSIQSKWCNQHNSKRVESRRSYKSVGLLFLDPQAGFTHLYQQMANLYNQGKNPFEEYIKAQKVTLTTVKVFATEISALITRRLDHTYKFYSFEANNPHNHFLLNFKNLLRLANQTIQKYTTFKVKSDGDGGGGGDTGKRARSKQKKKRQQQKKKGLISFRTSDDILKEKDDTGKNDEKDDYHADDIDIVTSMAEFSLLTGNNKTKKKEKQDDQTELELLSEFTPLMGHLPTTRLAFELANDLLFGIYDIELISIARFYLVVHNMTLQKQLLRGREICKIPTFYEEVIDEFYQNNLNDLGQKVSNLPFCLLYEFVNKNPEYYHRINAMLTFHGTHGSATTSQITGLFVRSLQNYKTAHITHILAGMSNSLRRMPTFTDMSKLEDRILHVMTDFYCNSNNCQHKNKRNNDLNISFTSSACIRYLTIKRNFNMVLKLSNIDKLVSNLHSPHFKSIAPTAASLLTIMPPDMINEIREMNPTEKSCASAKTQVLLNFLIDYTSYPLIRRRQISRDMTVDQKMPSELKTVDIRLKPTTERLMGEIDATLLRGLAFNVPVMDILMRSVYSIINQQSPKHDNKFSEHDAWVCVRKIISSSFSRQFGHRLGVNETDRFLDWPDNYDETLFDVMQIVIWETLQQFASAWKNERIPDMKSTHLLKLRTILNSGKFLLFKITDFTSDVKLNGRLCIAQESTETDIGPVFLINNQDFSIAVISTPGLHIGNMILVYMSEL